MQLNKVLNRFQLTNGCLLGMTTLNTSSNYLRTRKLQLTLEDSGIEQPALRNCGDRFECGHHVG
jgi:hypothetical protein